MAGSVTSSAERRREWLLRLALVGASLGLFLLVAEIVLRVSGFVPDRFASMGRIEDAHWTTLLDCYPTNPRGYFDIDLRASGSRERYHHLAPLRYDRVAERAPWAVEFRYNSLRFRDRPFGPKRPGVRRVMVLGDSFTEGQGVKEEDTTVRVLESLLNRSDPGRWEVLNCGRRGIDFPALNDAFEAVLPYEPDLLVYAMVLNDPEQSPAFHARQRYIDDWILDRGEQFERMPPRPGFWSSRLRALVEERLGAYRVGRETTRWYLEMYDRPNALGWAATEGYLRTMHSRLEGQGGQLLLALWPLLVDLDRAYPFDTIHEKVSRFCLEAGIPETDLLTAFRGHSSPPLWVHPVDRHPNERAHRIAAEALAPIVRKLLEPIH
jgi:hypothetical protein